MAVVTYALDGRVSSNGLNFDFLGDFTSFQGSISGLRWFSGPDDFALLSGDGFVFQPLGGPLVNITGGVINTLEVVIGGEQAVFVSNWALQAAEVFGFVLSGDDRGLRQLLTEDNDTISLSNGRDSFDAGLGNDQLIGLRSNDKLDGNKGSDTLRGGEGDDELTGGKDGDVFLFDTRLDRAGVDTITDFGRADVIALDDAFFAGIGMEGTALSNGVFARDEAGDRNDRIIYVQATGEIFFDADGNRAGEAVLFATVDPGTDLRASDFVIF